MKITNNNDTDLVQIGFKKETNTSHKKNILKKIQKQYQNEWDIVNGLSAPSKMPGFGYSIPAKACITGSKLAEIKGSVCYSCYAFRGNYTYQHVANALNRRLYGLTHPLWVPSMVTLINAACEAINEPYFRWHDSGDLQGQWHLDLIAQVCQLTPKIKHWLPTREYAMLNKYAKELPNNLVVRLSAHMIDGIPPSVDYPTSTVTTKEMPITAQSFLCGAYTREGFCGDCRACWNGKVKDITYPKH